VYSDLREFYNLKDDIGETTNLVSKMPEKVKEFDVMIEAGKTDPLESGLFYYRQFQ